MAGNFPRSEKAGASPRDPAEFYQPPPGGRVRRVISSGAKGASDDGQPSPADDRAILGAATAASLALGELRAFSPRSCAVKATSAFLRYFVVSRTTYPALSRLFGVPTIALSATSSCWLSGDFGIPMAPSSSIRPVGGEWEAGRRGSNFGPLFPEGSKEEGPDKGPPTDGGFLHSVAKVSFVERLFLLSRVLEGKLGSRIT